MTDHSDLIERARAIAAYNGAGVHDDLRAAIRDLTEALSSQSLSLSEASGGVDAVREAALAALKFYDGLDRPHEPGEARILDELQAALNAADDQLHGPFGHLVIATGLNEEHWRLSSGPDNDADHVSLPMFTKVDPFALASLSPAATPVSEAGGELFCDDEGCPHHGTPHICVHSQEPAGVREAELLHDFHRQTKQADAARKALSEIIHTTPDETVLKLARAGVAAVKAAALEPAGGDVDDAVESAAIRIIRNRASDGPSADRAVAHARQFDTYVWRDAKRDARAALSSSAGPAVEAVAWTPKVDAVMAVAKDMAEYLTGSRPDEKTAVRAAQFLWNCIDKGALSPLDAAHPAPATVEMPAIKALMKAIQRAEDGAGTLTAKEAVKLRPADWHAVCALARKLVALAPATEGRKS